MSTEVSNSSGEDKCECAS